MKKRVISIILVAVMLVSLFPGTAFAARDSTGKPLDLTGDVYLALYTGTDFPGEPAEYAVSGYLNIDSSFGYSGFTKFAESAEGLLDEQILDDVVQGTSGVWGVFSTTGGSKYLLPESGLVNDDGSHTQATEQSIIQAAIDNDKFTLEEGTSIEDYTIIWYVIKYQQSDSAWHIDGLITKKSTFSVNYYGNGNTSGGAPSGSSELEAGDVYTVLGNTGSLRKIVGNDVYIFNGWNTATDGTGTHYNAGDQITIEGNVTLYAEWYLQNKYTVTVVTKLDDVEVNASAIEGHEVTVWVKSDAQDSEYLELTQSTTGTYTTTVTENGSYYVYFLDAQGDYHAAHGHQVTIYNQNGRTELLNYSVSYDANSGTDTVTWSEGAAPEAANYHATTAVTAVSNVPSRPGYTFLYWLDQDGNVIYPGDTITESIAEKTVLTAQWQENINVTVNITVDHTPEGGGSNDDPDKDQVLFQLLQQQDSGVNLPYTDALTLDSSSADWSYSYNAADNTTTYIYTFTDLPRSIYHAACTKSHYDSVITYTGSSDTDQTIDILLTYAPDSFDLDFNVVVNFTEETKELLPKAVNVKISCWNGQEWVIITQQEGEAAPVTVSVDETGRGSGYFPVWKYWPEEGEHAYEYRVEVTSFVMPDGSIVPASGDQVTYKPLGAGLYTAVVTMEDGGRVPTYPQSADLAGAYYDGSADDEQSGIPTVTVDITPYKVTFVAGDGLLNGQETLVLENQYRYPDLREYVPVPNGAEDFFTGWCDEQGNPVNNLNGSYLTGDVTYYASYSLPMTVQGTVTAAGSYAPDGQLVHIPETDRIQEALAVLQKVVGDNLVDMDTCLVTFTYPEEGGLAVEGTGTYSFTNVPNDGSEYRIQILVHNYTSTYDNESDADLSYSPTEYTAVLNGDNVAVVDAYLDLVPQTYEQMMAVDASLIQESFRPTEALAEVLYRDLGDIHPYNVISQHTVAPYGTQIPLAADGRGSGSYSVWQYHTDGTLYEYQMNVTKLYGNVEGVFTAEGVPYNSDTAPFTIEYDPASRYSAVLDGQARTLKATLVPKEYEILFDLGVDAGESVEGMDQFLTDGEGAEDYYSYQHTWSYADSFMAFPYRQGYVFEGWSSSHEGVVVNNHGYVTVGAAVAEDVVLTAQWRKLEGTAYTVRYLELSTEVPLRGAVVVEGAVVGTTVKAVDVVQEINGYSYAGAMIADVMYSLNDEPVLTVTENAEENLLTIYYVADGYTDQVESNLKLDKTAVLEDNGTYTINLETYTMDNPVTTLIQQNTPLDIVLVLDQSGSLAENNKAGLTALQGAVDTFVESIANHGRINEVDHRIAVVGYASNQSDGTTSTDASANPYSGGKVTTAWVNTGVFDSNGEFHNYNVTGFNYTPYTGTVSADGTYYVCDSDGNYLLLSHHDEYRHLITEEEARLAVMDGTTVYGYVYDDNGIGSFVELTRNSSGLWLYGDKQLYSLPEFFTYHQDVWTHRNGLAPRQIHAYGTGADYTCADGHDGLYTRTETTGSSYQLSVYSDALIPVSVGANGSGGVNPGLIKSDDGLGANGATRASYGVEMANAIFAANEAEDRVRIMVMFTDGKPGQSGYDSTEANATVAEAYITKNTYGAYVYTIGLYDSNGVDATSDEAFYMNAVSSNYPDAQSVEDVKSAATYVVADDGDTLGDGDTYYVKYNDSYYEVNYGRVRVSGSWIRQYCWYYTRGNTNYRVSSETSPSVSGGMIGSNTIYEYRAAGYADTEHSGYYSTTDSTSHLEEYFANVMTEITTKITQEIILHEDTILRDIMGQGLVLTPGTVITAYKVAGTYNTDTAQIDWADTGEQVAQVTIPENPTGIVSSPETTTVQYILDNGTQITKENVPYINVYNLTAENPTDPDAEDYHPHTVDVTGYDFENWYISPEHPEGYKMVVQITRVEATEDVQWGRSTTTNYEQSGLWLPEDENGERQLLLPFDQPTTIFVERAYVLDYGKEFTLSGWYFDDQDGKSANPVHMDCDITNGMNWFDETSPNTSNGVDSQYGNTQYGNVSVRDGKVTYSPTSMNWGGFDQFYVFGDTWRKTVLAQDANQNGNLWNKVTVIPANNIYYEDSFVTTEDSNVNGIEGFTFTGAWEVISGDNAFQNTEIPEHLESAPYGDVHGWTDSLGDDITFTDDSAHATGLNGEMGAMAEFTFTGTGVDVYTRTNANSGMVVAVLTRHTANEAGAQSTQLVKSIAMDNLAVSGDYYHIPTASFKGLVYGTYSVKLIATAASNEDGTKRFEYYLDGVRVYNPLGSTTNYASDTVKDAYGLETNAVFTEVRDILLDYGDFNTQLPDSTDGKMGAVFIDQIKDGQGSGSDQVGAGVPTYEIGTFEAYGPKNEVYLSAGQAIVLKVDPSNTYYVGLKSLTGAPVTANVSGITQADPTAITLSHTTDMYYQITPVDGYIVIQNGGADDAVLSVTNLRTTNLYAPAADGGVQPVAQQEAVRFMRTFSVRMAENNNTTQPSDPTEEDISSPGQQYAEAIRLLVEALFGSVRTWLRNT